MLQVVQLGLPLASWVATASHGVVLHRGVLPSSVLHSGVATLPSPQAAPRAALLSGVEVHRPSPFRSACPRCCAHDTEEEWEIDGIDVETFLGEGGWLESSSLLEYDDGDEDEDL